MATYTLSSSSPLSLSLCPICELAGFWDQQIKMGHKKALTGFSTFIVILMVASIPFVQPSRLQVRTFTLTENTKADKFGNGEGAKVFNAVEDSARQVPAGPDPLHHNNNPIGP